MRSIVYISQETQTFTTQDLGHLLKNAVVANRKNGITGYLHYEGGYFIQCIEGEPDPLYETMARISKDTRHAVFYKSEEHHPSGRRFPDWFMGWRDKARSEEIGSAISDLTRTLEPFERLISKEEHQQIISIYKQISYDHVLRGLTELKNENNELAGILSMAVHDLRSPTRAIARLLEMYIEDRGDALDSDFEDTARYMKAALNQMEGLVDGILHHFDADTHGVMETVDVVKIIDEIRAAIELQNSKGAVVQDGALPTLPANSLKVWRVLNCLIRNGLKYNRSAQPMVEVSAERDDGYWVFCVRDNGIGISPKFQDRIFKMFTRLHTQSAYPGSGVGLATCRKLVEQWHGRIWVSSDEGEGARFYFTHPILRGS